MHTIRTCILSICLLFTAPCIQAQTSGYQAPATIDMSTAEACRRNKEDFIKASDYVLQAPVDAADRKEAAGIAMLWITNTDEVSININEAMMKYFSNDFDQLYLFTIGWARHVLQTGERTQYAGNLAGMRALLKYYSDPAHKMPLNKNLDKLAKLEAKGKLEAEVAAMLKTAGIGTTD